MGELEAVGDVVTGGMIGRAVEPKAGAPGADGHTHERNCLNCGKGLTGPYCAACGQKARVHRSLATFLHDMIQGLFNFEGKIWRTLPMLAWRPGEMTRRYVAGQRARFVSPVALYLFSVFLMFAVLNLTGAISPNPNVVNTSLAQAVVGEEAELARLGTERKAALARGADVAALDRRIVGKQKDVAQIERMRRGEFVKIDRREWDQAPLWLREANARVERNPQAFILKVQDATSKFSWLLIPLSVPFLWLLFPFDRRYHLYDHTVFVTYSLSFMMILVIVGGLLVALGAPGLGPFLFFVPPLHMYRQLKGAYRLSRLGALLRTFALMSFALVASVIFFLAMLGVGMFD